MRDILTGLAIVVIVILTTMLVAPYFVDWNGQRGFLEAQLSRALGQTVTIGGPIDLKLLPTPYIRLGQAVIGSDDGAVRVGIHHLDLELAVAPLLHGEFDVVEGRLDEPTIRLTLQPDRTLPALPPTPALKADIRLERITVRDGTLALADPSSGHTYVLDHLDVTADAPSLAGPFKVSGATGLDTDRTQFRFSTSESRKGGTRLHLVIGASAAHPGLDLDGDLALDAADGAVRQSFAGTATAIGQLAAPGDPPLTWRLSGPLKADPAGATLSGGELRLGGESGLAFKADVKGTFGETATLAATLAAARLDVDRLGGLPADPAKPRPVPQLPSPSRLRALAAAAVPGVLTRLDVTIDNATWAGQALEDLALHLEPASGGGGRLRATGSGPGGLHLSLDGTVPPDGTGFDGRAALGAADLPRALTWLEAVAPDIAPARGALPFSAVEAEGQLSVDGRGIASTAATLDLDRSHLRGALRLAFGNGGAPAHLTADLSTDTLDLDALPRLRGLRRSDASLAFDLELAAGAVHVATVGDGALDAGRVSLDLAGTADRLALRRLSIENLGGATVSASGSLADKAATFAARIDADRLEAAAALLGRIAPGPWADRLAARAGALAPAHLTIDTRLAAREPRGGLAPSQLKLDGTLAGTDLHLALDPRDQGSTLSIRAEAPDGLALLHQLGVPVAPSAAAIGAGHLAVSASGDIEGPLATKLDATLGATSLSLDGRFDLLGKERGGSGTARLKSADLGPVARGLGLVSPDAARPLPADLAGALAAGQNGVALSGLSGHLAGAAIEGTLKIVPPAGNEPVLTGTLDLDRLALGALVETVLGPSRTPAAGAAWSAEPFAAAASAPPRADLTLRARTLDLFQGLVAKDAALDLRVAPGLAALTHAEAKLDGGRVNGTFTLRRDGAQATINGSVSADGVGVRLPALGASLSGKLDIAGGGGTPLALVASLAGSGTATLADTRVPGADPGALPKVFALVEEDALSVDEEAVDRAFDETARAALGAGTRQVGLGLASGTLALTPTDPASRPAGTGVTSEVAASFDLRTRDLAVKATETLRDLPKDWKGPPPSIIVSQSGPPEAPRRGFDVSVFLDAVAARAIARESARVEAYEFDIRERSLLATRLQSDRRREQDRLKAEADAKAAAEAAKRAAAEAARKAEAERRARIEAARIERQRAEDAARAAQEFAKDPNRNPAAAQPGPDAAPDGPRFQAPANGGAADPSAAGRY